MNRPRLAPFSPLLASDLPTQLAVFPRDDQPAQLEASSAASADVGGMLEANLRRAGRTSPATPQVQVERPQVVPSKRPAPAIAAELADVEGDDQFANDAGLDDDLTAGLIYDDDDEALPAPGDFYFERDDRDDD